MYWGQIGLKLKILQSGSVLEHLVYFTSGPFGGPLSANFPDVKKVQQRLLAICILNFEL